MSELTPDEINEINRQIAAGTYQHREPAETDKPVRPSTSRKTTKRGEKPRDVSPDDGASDA